MIEITNGTAPGETGTKLRCQSSSNKEAIHSMERILECDTCGEQLHILAIKIPTKLATDASPKLDTESRGKLITMLAGIFTSKTKDSSIRELAGEALAMLSESNATIILKENDGVVRDLSKMLLDCDNNKYKTSAAESLKHLCIQYKENDDHLKKLKERMKDVMPEVLAEILSSESTGKQLQAGDETDKDGYSAPGADLEDGKDGGASQDNDPNKITPSLEQKKVDRKLQAALLSLTAAVFHKLFSENSDFAQLLGTLAPRHSASSFVGKLRVETNSEPTASCLRITKKTTKMVISMRKQGGLSKQDLESLDGLMKSVSIASANMLRQEGFMVFDSANRGAGKPVCSLCSLVKLAQVLLDKKKQAQE